MEVSGASKVRVIEETLIDRGKLQVAMIGGFACGKSTLLKALLKSDIPGIDCEHTFPVMFKIVAAKEKEEKAFICFKNETVEHKKKEYVPVELLMKKLTAWSEVENIIDTINYIKLSVSDAVLPDNIEIFLCLGGTYYMDSSEQFTEIMKSCGAIIYSMSAHRLFSREELDYIAGEFKFRNPESVFFVINHYDDVPEDSQEKFKDYVYSQLHKVYCNRDGKFNKELYQERVFFVDGYGAYCARTGKPKTISFGNISTELPSTGEMTGFPEFAKAFYQFLYTGDRGRR